MDAATPSRCDVSHMRLIKIIRSAHFYVKHLKRYDGVWQNDVAKCGMYGALDHGDGQQCAVVLPPLELDQPLRVLGNVAQDLMQRDSVAGTPGP